MGLRKFLTWILGDLSEIPETDHAYTPNLSVGVQDPSARAHFPAGKNEAGGSPIKIDPGVLMDILELGAVEFDGKNFYITLEDDPENPPEEIGTGTGSEIILDDDKPAVINKGLWFDPYSGTLSVGINDTWVKIGVSGIKGKDGNDALGFTSANYNPATGIITFLSDDGLGFVTEDLRAVDGNDGLDATAASGTGTVLSLTKIGGTYYNMGAASSATVFTTSGTALGTFACTLINVATEPTVTGATKIKGSDFKPSTDMHLWVQYFGVSVQYFFAEL